MTRDFNQNIRSEVLAITGENIDYFDRDGERGVKSARLRLRLIAK
jgi:hypothetical protein